LKKWVIGTLACIVIGVVIAIVVFKFDNSASVSELPTIAALPTNTPTSTQTIAPTPTATATSASTATSTPTETPTPSDTPTLATLILQIMANDARSTAAPPSVPSATVTPTALPTYNLPSPPPQIPDALTSAATPGWIRYGANDPAFEYTIGRWFLFKSARASGGSYMYSADPTAVAVLPFDGAGIRVRYVTYALFGIFEVQIDGQVVAVMDSYQPRAEFMTTNVFGLVQGKHTLEIINTARKNVASGGNIIALDAVEVYQGPTPTATRSPSPSATATFTPSPVVVQNIKLISGPPVVKPTNTPIPPSPVIASLVIAYDENGNNAVDPGEGVQGISVRLVKSSTNEVLESGFTNTDGFVQLEALSDGPVRLIVPYFGKFWDVSSGGAEPHFTLILPPGNQPGLIP